MKKFDVIIIGAGPAGIITGITAKNQYPEKSILMFREEEKGLVPCGIPYIFHNLNSVDKNIMGPKGFIDMGGEVITDSVIKVDTDAKSIKTKSGDSFEYDKLVFAMGSRAVIATFIPGHDLENVFYIRKSYNYIKTIFTKLQEKRNIVVVGGGFIGAEMAEQLAMNPKNKVTLIESEKFCFSKAFSEELSAIATDKLKSSKVNVYTSTNVEEVAGEDGKVKAVKLNNGEQLEADAVIFAVGYRPNIDLAKEANIHINEIGAIIVDNYGLTLKDDVYAVGDCAQKTGFLTGRGDYIMLASTATAEARILGYNIFGVKIKNSFTGTIGIFSTKINGTAMAAAGLNEKNAIPSNINFITSQFTSTDRHPAGIEGATSLTAKLYVCPTDGSILGGEVWGGDTAGEMINTIGLAIQKGVTIYELISFQIGTHPLLTSAPTMPVLIKAAELALSKIKCEGK